MAITKSTDRPVKKQLSDSSPIVYNRCELFSGVGLHGDGTNDKVDIGDTGETIKTIIVWIKADTTTEKIIDFDSGTHVLEISTGTVTATGFDTPTTYIDGYSTNDTVAASVWVMVAATTATGFAADDMDLMLSAGTYFGGEMSNVIIYTQELTAVQIAEVWNDPGRPLASGLVAADVAGWWPLCENDANIGLALDYSGNANDGTISGATYTNAIQRPVLQTATKGSKYLNFEGTDTRVTHSGSSAVSLTGAFTILCWCYPRLLNSVQNFFNAGAELDLIVNNADSRLLVEAKVNGSVKQTWSAVSSLTVNTKYLVGGRYDGANVDAILNGVSSGTPVAATGNMTTFTQDFEIGREFSSSAYLDGLVYEVVLFNTALTDAELLAVYNSGTPLDFTTNSGNYLSSSSIVWHTKNEGNRTWTDLQGNYDGTPAGTAGVYNEVEGLTAGLTPIGYALDNTGGKLSLSGAEYGLVPTNSTLEITVAITLMGWIKFESTGSQETIISKDLAYALHKGSSELLIMSVYQTTNKFMSGTATLVADTWTHVAGTYDGTSMKTYINGELDKTGTSFSGTFDSNSNEVEIGRVSAAGYFTGQLDDIQVHDAAKTAQEIRQDYRAGLATHS